jgi:hypothetical protein
MLCVDRIVREDPRASDREAMPRLRTIQRYWEDHQGTLTIFPDLPVRMMGWGEPFCFRCGWLAPVKDWAAYTQGSSEDKMTKVWNGAAGWLEALRTGEVPAVPSRDDPAYCWPAGPEKHVAMLSLVNR